ncbi:hypothetical protein HDU97_009920 [Phlyctochytrium planicorne]|nr:hypothetical protein HDU97_009920 [Phlyctochytrium planicorne]
MGALSEASSTSTTVMTSASAASRILTEGSMMGAPSTPVESSSFNPIVSTFRSLACLAAGMACGLFIIRMWKYPNAPLFPSSFAEMKRDILGDHKRTKEDLSPGSRKSKTTKGDEDRQRRREGRRRKTGFMIETDESSGVRRRGGRRRHRSTSRDVRYRHRRSRSVSPETPSPITPYSAGHDSTRRAEGSRSRLLAPPSSATPASATSPFATNLPFSLDDLPEYKSPLADELQSPQFSNVGSPTQELSSSSPISNQDLSPSLVSNIPESIEAGFNSQQQITPLSPSPQSPALDGLSPVEEMTEGFKESPKSSMIDSTSDEIKSDSQGYEYESGEYHLDEDESYSYSDDGSEDDQEEDTAGYIEESKKLLDLLQSIAEDQAQKDGTVHRAITCNHCGISPVRGIRYKCTQCVEYDICETCEAGDVHPSAHILMKIHIPIPPYANPRIALLPTFYPGRAITEVELDKIDFKTMAAEGHYNVMELQALYHQFCSLATVAESSSNPLGIPKEIFDHSLGPLGKEKNLISERIFAFFDQDKDTLISFPEFIRGLGILCKGSLDERIKYAFEGYDLNSDGVISRHELLDMFKAFFTLSMELVRDFVKGVEADMMENFDDEGSKPVSSNFSAPIQGDGQTTDDDIKKELMRREEPLSRRQGRRAASNHEGDITENILLGPSYQSPSAPSPGGVLARRARAQETLRSKRSNASLGDDASLSISTASSQFPASPLDGKRLDIPVTPLDGKRLDVPMTPLSTASPLFGTVQYGNMSPTVGDFNDHRWPMMEEMGQDAVEEMVEKTFMAAGASNANTMTFEQFKKAVDLDGSLLQWFEALGSVF